MTKDDFCCFVNYGSLSSTLGHFGAAINPPGYCINHFATPLGGGIEHRFDIDRYSFVGRMIMSRGIFALGIPPTATADPQNRAAAGTEPASGDSAHHETAD